MDAFEYDSSIHVRFLEDAFDQEPLIHFEEIAWVYEKAERKFKHWETGFFKPANGEGIQFYVSHNTGRIEVTNGEYTAFDKMKKSFELRLESDFMRNEAGLKTAYKSFRTIQLNQDSLDYVLEMSTEDVSGRTLHLKASLSRVT